MSQWQNRKFKVHRGKMGVQSPPWHRSSKSKLCGLSPLLYRSEVFGGTVSKNYSTLACSVGYDYQSGCGCRILFQYLNLTNLQPQPQLQLASRNPHSLLTTHNSTTRQQITQSRLIKKYIYGNKLRIAKLLKEMAHFLWFVRKIGVMTT